MSENTHTVMLILPHTTYVHAQYLDELLERGDRLTLRKAEASVILRRHNIR
jgi:hypothetical protein